MTRGEPDAYDDHVTSMDTYRRHRHTRFPAKWHHVAPPAPQRSSENLLPSRDRSVERVRTIPPRGAVVAGAANRGGGGAGLFRDFVDTRAGQPARARDRLLSRDCLGLRQTPLGGEDGIRIFGIDAIEALLGERCRYVCVCRDGLDTVCSIKELCDEMDRYLPELHAYLRVNASPLEAIAHAWADVNTRLLPFAADHASSCCWVRSEDMAANAVAELDRIFQFLDEPADTESVLRTAFAGGMSVGLGDWKTYEAGGISTRRVGRSGSWLPTFSRASRRSWRPRWSASGILAGESLPPAAQTRRWRRYRAMKMVKQLESRTTNE